MRECILATVFRTVWDKQRTGQKQSPWLSAPQKLKATGPTPRGSRGRRVLFLRAGFASVQGLHVSDVAIRLTFERRGV